MGEEAPDAVLRRIFLNLEKLKLNGDEIAVDIQKKLRLIVSFLCLHISMSISKFYDLATYTVKLHP